MTGRSVREVFLQVAEARGADQSALLATLCAGDSALKAEVESLLAAAQKRPEFLGSPTAGVSGGSGSAWDRLGDEERAGDWIGRYRLLEEIGRGGFGTVYMAEQETPVQRRVALKIINLGMDTRAVIARFEAERQALALMDHPHIARVFDGGATASGRPYFVMELVQGTPISVFADSANLDIRERIGLFVQVCRAVQHAHSKGVIHRDIKPANILVSTHDGAPHVKVIDFGIAKATERRLTEKTLFTQFRQFVGTPEYMSPEQAGAAPDVDTRSDVYSLGALLYELLTGTTPFDPKALRSAAYDEIQRIIREEEPARPSTRISRSEAIAGIAASRGSEPGRLSALVTGDLDWIVMKALEKDRGRRYETAGALADDLQRHMAGDPVSAAPPSAGYRLRKLLRRHKGLAVGVVAVTGALVLGIIGTSIGLARANDAKGEAVRGRKAAEYDAYIANVESAYSALRFNDTTRMRVRLAACPEDQRNWEWRYLNAACDGSVLVLEHGGQIWRAAYSRDGARIATSCLDGQARIWDAATGEALAAFAGPSKFRGEVGFSPDGSLILASAMDGRIWVWDSATRNVVAVLTGHEKVVQLAVFLDDARILSAAIDGTARVWEARTGKEVRLIRLGASISRASLSQDGLRLATAGDQTIRVWRVDRDEDPLVLSGHTGAVATMGWSADGTRLVTASVDGTARSWDASTGTEIARFQHGTRANLVGCSPDGSRVVSCGFTGDPRVWDASTGRELFTLIGHTNTLGSVQFSHDGRWILTGARDNTARLWDARTGAERSCLRGHVGMPWTCTLSPDGMRIMTGGDTTIRVWPLDGDHERSIVTTPVPESVAMSVGADDRTVLEAGDGRVRLVDVPSGRESLLFEGADLRGPCALAPDGSTVLAAFNDGAVGAWDVARGARGATFVGHTKWANWIAFRADGGRILTAGDDGTCRIWEASTGAQTLELRGHAGAVVSAEYDHSGARVVTGGSDKTVRIWDAQSGVLRQTMTGHEGVVLRAVFGPDGSRILSTSTDATARIWNATSGEQILVLRGHENVVTDGCFSPDGTRLATCSFDGTVRIWDAANGRQILSMGGRPGGVLSVRFSADGSRLFFGSTEGKAWILDSLSVRERIANSQAK